MEQAILTVKDNGCLFVDGEITFYNATQLCSQLQKVVPSSGKQLTIELAKLTNCDSASLVFLIMLLRHAETQAQTVKFLHIPKNMQALIGLYNLGGLISEGEHRHAK